MAKERLSAPRHKVREEKKEKTVVDKLKGSALFILFMILVFTVNVVSFIFWLSGLLSGNLSEAEIFTAPVFFVWVGLGAAFAVFITWARLVQKRAHG